MDIKNTATDPERTVSISTGFQTSSTDRLGWAGRSGDRIPVVVRLFATVQTCLVAHTASVKRVPCFFPGGKVAGVSR
jgi:hypothetical protein